MTRRQLLCTLSAGAPLAMAARPPKPNVILILTDDQGYGDLACHGNPLAVTPHIDRLHSESTRFTNFHVDPTCSPSRSALMTGMYSHRAGVWHTIMGRNYLHRDAVTMADAFKSSGYRTGLFGKWHLGTNYPYRPIDRGFDTWVGHGNGGIGTSSDYWDNQKLNDTYLRNGVWEKFQGFSTDVFFSEAMRFIGQSAGAPFFAYLPTNVPHLPLNVPDEFLDSWKTRTSDPMLARFYASIERVDTNIGRLLTFLTERNLLENTIVMFMTDNGGTVGVKVHNAGMRGAKGDAFDGGHRVPCFIRWPRGGIERGRDDATLTAHLDIFPTLIDLCALKKPAGATFDGVSLAPLLHRSRKPWHDRALLVESQRIPNPRPWKDCAIMTQRWRLIDGTRLYDIKQDPAQQQDVASANPAVVQRLRREYETLWPALSQRDNELGRPIIGTAHQPVTWFAPDERFAPEPMIPWDQPHVRRGNQIDGIWPAEISVDGTYEFTLRRWPREVSQSITAALPPLLPDGSNRIFASPAGVSLALVKARLKVGDVDLTKTIPERAQEVVFQLPLKQGPVDLQAWFYDSAGDGSRGAYYLYARRLGE